jgi:hypothetical protein
LLLPGGRTFEDGKRYRFEVDIDKIEREEDTNRLLYSCLYYEDEDREDMYWMSQDGFETQGLLDVLDYEVLDRIAPLMVPLHKQCGSIRIKN